MTMTMISNLLYVIRLWFLGLVTAVFVLTGCSEEAFVEPTSKGTTLTLHFPPMEQITTRAGDKSPGANWCNANISELKINKYRVLFFDSEGLCIKDITSNIVLEENGKVVLPLYKEVPLKCHRMVVLCNYDNFSSDPIGVHLGEIRDFLSKNMSMGGSLALSGIPMFGFVNEVFDVEGSLSCQMYYSVAKIQLAVSEDIYNSWKENDKVSYSWAICPISLDWYNNMYPVDVEDNGCPFLSWDYVTPYFPTTYGSYEGNNMPYHDPELRPMPAKKNANGSFTVEHMEVPDFSGYTQGYYEYSPEFQNSTRTLKGKTVDAKTFDKDRMCLILKRHVSINNYSYEDYFYRIDFLTGNGKDETKQYIDILRNRHYVVTITDMKGMGYTTLEEALNNPPSNIEYTIEGLTEESVVSNGKYALGFTQEWTHLKYYMDPEDFYTENDAEKNVMVDEITLGYVDAVFKDDLNYELTTNYIGFPDLQSYLLDYFVFSDPGQQVTQGRMPVKMKWMKTDRSEWGWNEDFTLTLRLGDLEQSFEYSFSVSAPAISSTGTSIDLDVSAENGVVSVEDITDSFISIEKNNTTGGSVVKVAPNPSSASRTQWGMVCSPSGDEKVKVVVTQKGKE